jgi:hypothetical protein
MNVEDTNQKTVKCSKCGEQKPVDRIVKNRKICKDCCNKKKLQKHKENITKIDTNEDRKCKDCDETKNITLFSRKGMSHICIDCSNKRRREKYDNNEEHRKKAIKDSTEFKKKKKEARDKIKKEELKKLENKIGKDNTICKYCKEIKPKSRFRHNRLKCKDCERDDPKYILHKRVRSRIHDALFGRKTKHTHEYLGCTREEYINWLLNNENGYDLDNYGAEWHIDHVIPLSKFDLEKEEDIYLAFNWRNTMPLSAEENLSKNNKILPQQIKQHFDSSKIYHKDNKIKMPREFIDLYAKHLEAGIPLEP